MSILHFHLKKKNEVLKTIGKGILHFAQVFIFIIIFLMKIKTHVVSRLMKIYIILSLYEDRYLCGFLIEWLFTEISIICAVIWLKYYANVFCFFHAVYMYVG